MVQNLLIMLSFLVFLQVFYTVYLAFDYKRKVRYSSNDQEMAPNVSKENDHPVINYSREEFLFDNQLMSLPDNAANTKRNEIVEPQFDDECAQIVELIKILRSTHEIPIDTTIFERLQKFGLSPLIEPLSISMQFYRKPSP